MTKSLLKKNFGEWGGVDLRSTAKTRQPKFAENAINCSPVYEHSFACRGGIKGYASDKGGGGLCRHVYIDFYGVKQEELLAIDENLHRLTQGIVTITYSGSAAASIYIGPDSDVLEERFVCKLFEDEVEVFSQDLGTGINEGTPYTLASLISAIDALANFGCTATGTTTGPAAFLPNTSDGIGVGGLDIPHQYWTQIYSPVSDPFSVFWSFRNAADWQTADMMGHANRLFIATGYNKLYKYDGVSCFAAGMPEASNFQSTITSGGSLSEPNSYYSFITYEQADAVERIVEGNPSNTTSVTSSSGNQQITHTIPYIQPSSGFLTSCAIVAGAQVGVITINVDDGSGGPHTIQVGQTVYFKDSLGNPQERLVVLRTNSTITLSGLFTSVADNEVISANLVINLWRNRAGGAIPYLVATFANNSFATDFTYVDNIADSDLLIEYEEPAEGHDLPPENLRYLTAFQNGLMGASIINDEVGYSDPDGPEYWPLSFVVRSKDNGPITGLGANREIALVFKETEVHALVGSLPESKFRVEKLVDDIGCSSHKSILDVDGTLWFYSKKHGIRRIISTVQSEEVSFRVFPAIIQVPRSNESTTVHNRVMAIDNPNTQQAIYFFPRESANGSDLYPNENSFFLVADYAEQRDNDNIYDAQGRLVQVTPKVRWWPWNNFDIAGGIALFQDKLVFTQRLLNEPNGVLEYPLSIQLATDTLTDYCDHAKAIPWAYYGGWEDFEEPDVLKKWTKAVIYSFSDALSSSFTVETQLNLGFVPEIIKSLKNISFGIDGGGGSGWGYPAWGEFPWGAVEDNSQLFTFIPSRSASARLAFSSNVYLECPLISGWDIECVPVFDSKIKKGAS